MTRVAVITGASSGLGKAAAKALAAQGWWVIAVGRNAARSAAAEAEIRGVAAEGARVDMLIADLALLADAERLAREIAGLTDRIEVLANNAGGMASGLVITDEGNEANFTGNHLGPFLLTELLLPLLRRAAADAPRGERADHQYLVRCQRDDPDDQPRRYAEHWQFQRRRGVLRQQAGQCFACAGAGRAAGG
jgi:NAD(P)-dependent dehydrogenase (short-subunit alcohol dehydrogenase family)